MEYYYYPSDPYYPTYRQIPVHNDTDQRFFPILLPFVAGLAISPLLFNRPFYQPYPYPVPYPTPYPTYPGYAGNPVLQQPYTAPVLATDNLNIYNR